jgi:hypothetical protein
MTAPTSAAPLPTRQQLDEIDALLRRMLTLPPMGAEAPSSPPPPATVFSPPSEPIVREFQPSQAPAPNEPNVRSWRVEWPQSAPPEPPAPPPSLAAWGSPVPSSPPVETVPWASHPATPATPPFAAAVVETPRPQTTLAPPVYPQPPAASPARGPAPSTSILVSLLVLLNGTFNILSYLLGPLGAWLRGPGRAFLGWGGIAMMLAAILWAVGEWYGYDWPRPDLSRFGLKR